MLITLNENQLSEIQNKELRMLKELNRICRKHNIKYVLAYGTLLGAVRHKGFIPWDDDVDVHMLREDYEKFKKIAPRELAENFFYQSNETNPNYFYLYDKIRLNDTLFEEESLENYDIHQGLYIDIFPVDYTSSNKFLAKIQYLKYKISRNILNSKYIRIKSRHGRKKIEAVLLKIMFFFISKKSLYKYSEKIAKKYNQGKYVRCFPSPYAKKEYYPVKYFKDIIDIDFKDRKFSIPKEYNEILKNNYGNYLELPPKEKRTTRHNLANFKL